MAHLIVLVIVNVPSALGLLLSHTVGAHTAQRLALLGEGNLQPRSSTATVYACLWRTCEDAWNCCRAPWNSFLSLDACTLRDAISPPLLGMIPSICDQS